MSKDRRVGLLPNLFAEQGLFLLSKGRGEVADPARVA